MSKRRLLFEIRNLIRVEIVDEIIESVGGSALSVDASHRHRNSGVSSPRSRQRTGKATRRGAYLSTVEGRRAEGAAPG